MIVLCIDDDWSKVDPRHPVHIVRKVGDPLPEKGKCYEVIGYSSQHMKDGSKREGYELAELDYSNYPFKTLLFNKQRFVVVDDAFVPNSVLGPEDVWPGHPVRKINMYYTMWVPMKTGKMPRKKKKMFKKYGMRFEYKPKK